MANLQIQAPWPTNGGIQSAGTAACGDDSHCRPAASQLIQQRRETRPSLALVLRCNTIPVANGQGRCARILRN